jgi:hypothetical protein
MGSFQDDKIGKIINDKLLMIVLWSNRHADFADFADFLNANLSPCKIKGRVSLILLVCRATNGMLTG